MIIGIGRVIEWLNLRIYTILRTVPPFARFSHTHIEFAILSNSTNMALIEAALVDLGSGSRSTAYWLSSGSIGGGPMSSTFPAKAGGALGILRFRFLDRRLWPGGGVLVLP